MAVTVFVYQAVDPEKSPVQGTISADSPRQARDLLRSRGLRIETLQQHNTTGTRWAFRWPGRRVSNAQLATAVRELATLLGVGIPVLEALDTISKQHTGAFQTSLLLLKDRIAAGASLAEAIREQPQVFDPLTLHMVEVGENAGNLDRVLEQLAEFKQRSLELKDRVVTALLYPVIVLTASCGVTLFLMTVVVPMLLSNLVEAGRTLPWPTRVLKGISDTLVQHGWWLALVGGMLMLGSLAWQRTAAGQRVWYRGLHRLPLVGTLARKQVIARLAMVIATLMRSGIVFVRAVEIGARATKDVVFREALEQTCLAVGAGHEIGTALEQANVFPPLVVQIFSVGQQTGRMEEMLERLATDYDREVSSLSSRLATALEPILIVLLAVIVGFIMFATVLPILEAGKVL